MLDCRLASLISLGKASGLQGRRVDHFALRQFINVDQNLLARTFFSIQARTAPRDLVASIGLTRKLFGARGFIRLKDSWASLKATSHCAFARLFQSVTKASCVSAAVEMDIVLDPRVPNDNRFRCAREMECRRL